MPPAAQPADNAAAAAAAAATARFAALSASTSRALAQRTAALASALRVVTSAQAALDAATLEFNSATADYEAAKSRASELHGLAADASNSAATAERAVSALVRSLSQQQAGAATADVLFAQHNGNTLLDELGTLDKLENLARNLETVRNRALEGDRNAESLRQQAQTADALADSIQVEPARITMDAARAALVTATARLTALRGSSIASFTVTGLVSLFNTADTGQLSAQGWALPVAGSITDGFGPRPVRPLPGVDAFHSGTDVAAACGTSVHAATAGVVEAAGPNGTLGNWILLRNGDGIETGYGHLATGTLLVAVGDTVAAGQAIAAVGDTGASTGCHLHFEVRIDSTRVDAVPFLSQRGIILGGG